MVELAELEREIAKFNPRADFPLIEKAYRFAAEHHKNQLRVSQEPYLSHLLATARILVELHLDEKTIAASLLHDIVEDTPIRINQLREEFGAEIAELVEGVTKLTGLKFKSPEEHKVENLRKMFVAMAKNVRVLVIKLADRLHNMRTLEYLPREKQERISRETLEIYAPLAHRLGIGVVKAELEDLALRYLEPEAYSRINESIRKTRAERAEFIQRYIEPLKKQLKKVGIKSEVSGRPKHYYSIYQKMKRKNVEITEIYDLVAIRVTTDSVKDCYGALGIVHTLWKPMPGRFKDYVAVPKPNMYQSLHTTVFGINGEPAEFQIRTVEMHRIAEEGIAAHWRYKAKGKSKTASRSEAEKFTWMGHILELKDPHDFMESLKIDLYEDQVYVFTPQGEVKELPKGSTPVDFAYAIHSDVGNSCVGAKVNDRIVPLRYHLANGDIVSILTSKQAKPNRDWLKFVKTSKARARIRSVIREAERENNIQMGRGMVERALKKQGVACAEALTNEKLRQAAELLNLNKIDDLFAEVGFGRVPAIRVVRKLCPDLKNKISVPGSRGKVSAPKTGVMVEGMDSQVMLRLSRCCNPVPGDKIIGLITMGRGVSVHRANCPNTARFDPRSLIEVAWYSEKRGAYEVSIDVEAFDRGNLLADILKIIAEDNMTINSASAWATKKNMAKCRFLVEIQDIEQLERLINKIKQVKSVLTATRSNPQ